MIHLEHPWHRVAKTFVLWIDCGKQVCYLASGKADLLPKANAEIAHSVEATGAADRLRDESLKLTSLGSG
jgi:hypothetical protein